MTTRRNILRLLGLSAILPSALRGTPTHDYPQSLTHQSKEITQWQSLARQSVLESTDAKVSTLIQATHQSNPTPIYYFGGSSPRQLRLISVESIFRTESSPHTYASAYCHLRREHRVFRVDKISLA